MITFYEMASVNDRMLVECAEAVAQRSRDKSTKTGVVITVDGVVVATGFNRLPVDVLMKASRLERPEKYLWTVHSEIVALGECAREGIRLYGSVLYSNWFPCADCTRAIIEHGIARVVGVKPDTNHPKYGHEFEVALEMLSESCVDVTFIGERVQVQK